MKAFFITVPVCLVAMIIVFAVSKQAVLATQPVVNSEQTETNKPISQEVIPQNDSTLTRDVNGLTEQDKSQVDTLNTGNKVAETDKGLSSDSSSTALPSLSDQKPKSDDQKIKNKTSVRKVAVNAARKSDDSIEFGDISPANTPTSGVANSNADGALVHKN